MSGLKSDDTLLAITTLSFDIAALELFLPLVVGGRVVIAGSDTSQDPEAFAAALSQHEVTALQATPTSWRLLIAIHLGREQARLKALCGGESVSRALADALLERCGEVWNVYGPTETPSGHAWIGSSRGRNLCRSADRLPTPPSLC